MSRWKGIVRGILGMGLTFGVVGAALFSLLALVLGVFLPGAESELGFVVIAGSVWSAAIGVAFSGALAIAGRHLSFEQLSLPRVAAMGAAGGLVLGGLIVAVSWRELVGGDLIGIPILLSGLGAGSATASLLLARRARPALPSSDENATRTPDEEARLPAAVRPTSD